MTKIDSVGRSDGARVWIVTVIGDVDDPFVDSVGIFTSEESAKATAFELTEDSVERVQVQIAFVDGGMEAGPPDGELAT